MIYIIIIWMKWSVKLNLPHQNFLKSPLYSFKCLTHIQFQIHLGSAFEVLPLTLWKTSKVIITLSIISLLGRKLLWTSSMTRFITFCSWFANTLKTILCNTLQRLIGWWWDITMGFLVFGTNYIWVWLITKISILSFRTF